MAARDIRMHGVTPRGRSRSYTYYTTVRKLQNRKVSVPTGIVDEQVLELLRGLGVNPRVLPRIRAIYREDLRKLKGPTLTEQVAEMQGRLQKLYEQEAQFARLYAVGKLSEKNYDLVYREWQEKVFETQRQIAGLEARTDDILTDLDQALRLLARVPSVFPRLPTIDQGRLLRILFRRIIIDTQGKVIDFELSPPFAYLTMLKDSPPTGSKRGEDVLKNRVGSGNSQPELPRELFHNELPADEVGQFAFMVSFPQRGNLKGLLRQIGTDIRDNSIRFEE